MYYNFMGTHLLQGLATLIFFTNLVFAGTPTTLSIQPSASGNGIDSYGGTSCDTTCDPIFQTYQAFLDAGNPDRLAPILCPLTTSPSGLAKSYDNCHGCLARSQQGLSNAKYVSMIKFCDDFIAKQKPSSTAQPTATPNHVNVVLVEADNVVTAFDKGAADMFNH